jgi:indolepyruvate ferredoxin oxidoreductase beta subunit
VRGDFARIADDTGSVISAVLFGAIASANVLPFTREQFEDAIRSGGKGIEASLRAFDKGFAVAAASERPTIEVTIGKRPDDYLDPVPVGPSAADIARATEDPSALVGSRLTAQAARIASDFPAPARFNLVMGLKRTAEYQDIAYADVFLDRVASVAALDHDPSARLTMETARHTALWMTYEDTIRVAFLKTRKKRFERVSGEARVSDEQLMEVREYLHPQIEEITDTLPTALGRWMLRSKAANALVYKATHKGLKLNTSSVWGYTMLYTMARMRPIRRRSLRFGLEQQRIDAWLGLIRQYAPMNYAFACEIAECAQVIKGYGETHARGWASFEGLMAQVPTLAAEPTSAADRLISLRTTALTN